MASNSLNILNNVNVPDDQKFKAVFEFVKSFGVPNEMNKAAILIRVRDVPFIEVLSRMLESEVWLKANKSEDIGLSSQFLEELELITKEEESAVAITGFRSLDGLSNNELRKVTCQRFSKLQQPKTWFSVEDILIWPVIVIKNSTFERKGRESVAVQKKNYIESILGSTSVNVGGVVMIEPGHSSIKVNCDSISSRTRIFEFLRDKLDDKWEMKIPAIANPIIRIHNVKLKSDNETILKDWLCKLLNRNGWSDPENVVKVIHCYKRTGYFDVLLSVTPMIRERVQRKNGIVNLGYALTKATDHFDIKLCGQCCRFGHMTNKCSLIRRCAYCSGNHARYCEAKEDRSKQRCPNCLKIGENAFDKKCSVFRMRLRHEMEKVNFNYRIIMY